MSQVSQIFSDTPWAILYPLWDKWYPGSKYIYTLRANTYNRVNSALKFEIRTKYIISERIKKFDEKQQNIYNETTKFLKQNETITWDSNISKLLMPYEEQLEFVMLMARNYEKHHENVMNYFGQSRIGENMDDDVLILCLECERDDTMIWKKLQKFLGCEWMGGMDDTMWQNIAFPHDLSAVEYMDKTYLPKDLFMNMDWREFEYGKTVTDVLENIYDDRYDAMDRMKNMSKNFWRWDMNLQRDLSRLVWHNERYMTGKEWQEITKANKTLNNLNKLIQSHQ